VQDLFPSFVIQETDYSFLTNKIEECLAIRQLQPHPPFMTKVIELFETFNVRFGVMLVGFTGAGKTTCYQTLADVMTSLRKEGHASKQFQLVNTTILNPKAISMGELYGQVDLIT
jgi:dynein heavy chain